MLRGFQHPNIIAFIDHFEEPDRFYLVLELLSGGELLDRIIDKDRYTEKEACSLVYTIVSTLAFMHRRHIIHRDMKPENVLLKHAHDDTSVKICDFGLAVNLQNRPDGVRTLCGSPGYMAPEISRGGGYGAPVHIWATGVIVYIMLCGFSPFEPTEEETENVPMEDVSFSFPLPYWRCISDPAKDFITAMLIEDKQRRWSADNLLSHPWLANGVGSKAPHAPLTHLNSAIIELKKFNAKQKLRCAVDAVTAARRLSSSPLAPTHRPLGA
jgi:calcium/calmodulin-dependent protein kinase I